MSERKPSPAIRLRGVRHNNLKNFDLDLPLNRLIVITGLSGSGKSSLAFDTLFAEGQRRYIETFSPYARQFFDRMDKPQVDSIEGIPPAIAIEQRNAVRTTRSTVGTMTEICDYMKALWPHIAQLHCRQCGQPVRKDTSKAIWETFQSSSSSSSKLAEQKIEDEDEGRERGGEGEVLVTFDLPLSEKLSLAESLALVSKQGYQRVLFARSIVRLDEFKSSIQHPASSITVVQDRLKPTATNRPRFIEACEQAYHFGKGKLAIHWLGADSTIQRFDDSTLRFSNRLHCAACDIEHREPSPALFSFNHPIGACPGCKGFGRIITIDYDLAIPDRSKTLAEGAVKPWQTGTGYESQRDLMKFCRACEIPTDVPFEKLPKKTQDWVINGDKDYGIDEEHEWPRAWYGVKGYFRWLESKAYKMHVRVLLSRYRAYTTCPQCNGARLQPEALLYRLGGTRSTASPINETLSQPSKVKAEVELGPPGNGITLADFYALPIRDALELVEGIARRKSVKASDPLGLCLSEVRARLNYLNDVGLGYLTLDRPTRTLSGGETERVNLTTCLGTRLVNTLFVLDEPSVGLHPRDTDRLVRVLEQLRSAGNTVVVVEHEPNVMRAADQIVDLGPGHGATGGQVVFQGSFADILKSGTSLTGQYLSGRKQIEIPERRSINVAQASRLPFLGSETKTGAAYALNDAPAPMSRGDACVTLKLTNATRHNLKDVSVEIPLERFVCITGVSGSGKTTLIREVLLPALEANLKSQSSNLKALKASDRIGDQAESDNSEENGTRNTQHAILIGHEHLSRVVLVDQSILAKTPRSNPAVYIGAFDDIREFFAQSDAAKQRGFTKCEFSYNSPQGQCERCRGAGFEKIEMQFLSDVFIRCPDCNGRRYRSHILQVKIPATLANGRRMAWSAADMLDATVDEAVEFLASFSDSKHAHRAAASLQLLQEVGLGYLRLGQPINTLSGGESQRLKLVRHLAEAIERRTGVSPVSNSHQRRTGDRRDACSTLFLFDEPTTGLHFDDVRVLLKVFQRLVSAGHSVVVIEHNLDVIKCADWIIDLGPDAGDQGGKIVAEGTPEDVAACEASHTGKFLRKILEPAEGERGDKQKASRLRNYFRNKLPERRHRAAANEPVH